MTVPKQPQQNSNKLPEHWIPCGEIHLDRATAELVYLCTQCVHEERKNLWSSADDVERSNYFYNLTLFCEHKMKHFQTMETQQTIANEQKDTEDETFEVNPKTAQEEATTSTATKQTQGDASENRKRSVEEDTSTSSAHKRILFSPFDSESVRDFLKNEEKLKEQRATITQSALMITETNQDSKYGVISLLSDDEERDENEFNSTLSPHGLAAAAVVTKPDFPQKYECGICAAKFCQIWQLNYHKRKHWKGRGKKQQMKKTRSAPTASKECFQCVVCPKKYKHAKRLLRHMSKCHLQISKDDEVAQLLSILDGKSEPNKKKPMSQDKSQNIKNAKLSKEQPQFMVSIMLKNINNIENLKENSTPQIFYSAF